MNPFSQRGAATTIIITVVVIAVIIVGIAVYMSRSTPQEQLPAINVPPTSEEEQPVNQAPAPAATKNTGTTNSPAKYSGEVIAGSASPLLDFNQADYEAALQSNKLVVLYFYANWCPICARETANALYPAFNELASDQVIGFRANFNDNQTDENEEALAREFGIAYQHSKVFLKNGQRVLKSPEEWNKARYKTEITNALAP